MELFRQVNVDWLGRKWYFLAFSLVFSIAGLLSILFWHGIPLGVDFSGGTQVTVHFDTAPNEDHIRAAMAAADDQHVVARHRSRSASQPRWSAKNVAMNR